MSPTLFVLERCLSVTPYSKSDSGNIMYNITLDVISIVFGLVLDGTCMVQWQKKCINGEQPWEGIKCAEDNTKEQQSRQGKKGWKVMPTWQFCAISPARLISTMCHHYKCCHLASFCVSSVAKMHAAHSHSPALTWYLHSSVGGALILKNGGDWFISGRVFFTLSTCFQVSTVYIGLGSLSRTIT